MVASKEHLKDEILGYDDYRSRLLNFCLNFKDIVDSKFSFKEPFSTESEALLTELKKLKSYRFLSNLFELNSPI
jgi:hypothetical protein